MSPKEQKELKESLIKQLIKEGDSDDVKKIFRINVHRRTPGID